MGSVTLAVDCPDCGKEFNVTAELEAKQLAPSVRSKQKPVGTAFIYHVSTDDMKNFIIAKSRKYVPDIKIEMLPMFTEKKRKKENELHHSYASLRIAFSENIIDKNKEDLGWYGQIGQSSDDVRIIPSMYTNIINMYKYNPNDIQQWMSSYKNMEELEDSLGITESYLNDLQQFSRPQRVKSNTGEAWIIFAASAEKVLRDMMTDPKTNKVPGKIQIMDVIQITRDNVEFIVYLYPEEIEYQTNDHVKALLLGKKR